MSSTALTESLARLLSGLEGLLSGLESGGLPERASLDASWIELQRDFASVRRQLDCLDLSRPEHEDVREGVERCLRLHAVAAGVLVQRREGLALEQARCAAARKSVRRMKAAGSSGGSCDVQG